MRHASYVRGDELLFRLEVTTTPGQLLIDIIVTSRRNTAFLPSREFELARAAPLLPKRSLLMRGWNSAISLRVEKRRPPIKVLWI
jgi:hypothetical protein